MKKILKKIGLIFIFFIILAVVFFVISLFFDEAVLVRKGTFYRAQRTDKVVALTFDDGPSPIWTPQVLDELKKAKVKATFFMLGSHVERYPEIARRVLAEGHEIGNHTYDHHVLIYYKMEELEKEIQEAEDALKTVTGQSPRYFRPPKAWLSSREKRKIEEMGYKIVLWSLNSKDWVTFHDKQITAYILKRIQPGDIILFHDSGGVFTAEGGNRAQTIKTIPRLARKLKEKGYRFVTISELMGQPHS
ncbi:MAG: polysaccharide deacetylase family protein [Candidatus Omnitrophica bacterium]|nr:polysaccharide deacetylase family protein [Candidatus Omnitrophota bacterium]MDD5661933.1 polysaccharide deacetylase family protein [Candidatus Omnitrophota bacterium]